MNAYTISSVWEISYLEISIRIVVAMIVGGLVGFERELGNHPAGFRTHILVCVGSTLIVLLSTYGFNQFANEYNVRMDPARLAAQVISGIGFLGAGTILRTGMTISGLTTAASLWVVAAIGLSVGAGFYYGALFSTLLVFVVLFVFNKIEKAWMNKRSCKKVKVVLEAKYSFMNDLLDHINLFDVQINNLKIDIKEYETRREKLDEAIYLELDLKFNKAKKINEAIRKIAESNGVLHVELSDAKSF